MVWLLLGLIIFTYILNRLTLAYGFINLNYEMELDKTVVEIDERIEISSIIENRKPLNVSFLKIVENFSKGFNIRNNQYTIFVMPYQRVVRKYKVFLKERGLYLIDYVDIDVGDFAGFKTEQKFLPINKEIVVLPEKLELEENIVPLGSLSGDISVRRWIIDDPLMTIGIREYTGNEPERFIHWPSSIKYGNLMVKNFDFTSDNSVMVVLNIETMKPSFKPVEKNIVETAISLTRGILEEFQEARIPYGFVNNSYNYNSEHRKGHYHYPGLGQNHLDTFLEVLGRIDNSKIPSSFQSMLKELRRKQGNYTTIVIITPRILDNYIEEINLLSKTVNNTVVISLEDTLLDKLSKNITTYRSRLYD